MVMPTQGRVRKLNARYASPTTQTPTEPKAADIWTTCSLVASVGDGAKAKRFPEHQASTGRARGR
jgi:hypothetical protein